MKTLFARYKAFRKHLLYKLVIYYGFFFITLMVIGLNSSKFDAREFSPISPREQAFFQNESYQTEQSLNLDEIFEENLSVETANSFDVILEDKQSGVLSGVNQSNIKALQTFIYESASTKVPLQRRFESSEIYGPFQVSSEKRHYNQYFIKAVEAQEEWINTILDSSTIMLLILMSLGTPFLFWLSIEITKPIKSLVTFANLVATGNLEANEKLEIEGIYEIREVGKSFNHMVNSLKILRQNQQRMISDISHELKTPLARLQLATAILRRKHGEITEIDRIEAEIGKLDQMIKDLLEISRQQLSYQTHKTIFAIDEIWLNVLEDAKFETSQNNIVMVIKQNIINPHAYFINGDVDSLASALENLIRNAQKYAKSMLSVSMDIRNGHLVIVVEDDGSGVPESEYDNIFKPFYRIDEARARETGGTGLGLAIVKNAVQQHQGDIQASKSDMGGLKIELQIPIWAQPVVLDLPKNREK